MSGFSTLNQKTMTLLSTSSVSRFCVGASLCLAATAAMAAHPLASDDTGTQGKGHSQFELSTDRDRTRTRTDAGVERAQSTAATYSYGVHDDVDLGISVPHVYQRAPGEAHQQGLGDVALQAKWRFHAGERWSLALKPAVTLPSGSHGKGLGNGRATTALHLLAQYEAEPVTWLVNVGGTHNNSRDGQRKALWSASTALLYTPHADWTLAFDIGANRNPDREGPRTQSYALLGGIYHLNKDVDLDLGYRRSLQSGPVTHTVGAGLTVRW